MWIKSWLSSAKIKVLVNGEPGKKIIYRSGLRQGDPLTPSFMLAVEGLNTLFRKMENKDMIRKLLGTI